MRPLVGKAILLVATITIVVDAVAQTESTVILRAEIPPSIDGNIGLDEWSAATQIRDLHQVEPIEFAPPSEETIWFISYDESALYIAAKALDSNPSRIVAQELRQGASVGSDDSLHILIDPFNNKRSGYTFALNPNAVRFDGIYTSGTRLSSEWDGVWRGESRRTEDGWTMEMAIPFNTVTFDPANDTWGINLWREIPRKNETMAWSSRNGEVDPTVSGELSGFDNISQGLGLDLIPSISTTYVDERDTGVSDTDLTPALDINYKVGNALNALLTINTDFAATEVDGRQLGLQRFSLFFPEKRDFFLTDFDIFQFGGVPVGAGRASRQIGLFSGTNGLAFFSRHIGLSADREPVDILYGAKLSGRLGAYDFGTLYIRQDEVKNVDEPDLDVDGTGFVVARMTRSVLAESSIGAILTSGDPKSNDNNSLIGADFLYRNTRIGRNRSMVAHSWIQRSDNAGVNGNDIAYSAVISFPTQSGFEAGAQYQVVEENFRPALGFVNRVGVRLTGFAAGHRRVRSDAKSIREIEHAVSFERWEFLDTGRVQSQKFGFEYLTLKSAMNDRLRLNFSMHKEGLLQDEQPLENIGILIPAGEYSFNRNTISLRTAGHRPFSARLNISEGGFFNGERLKISPELEWVPNQHLNFSLGYSYNKYEFPDASATTRRFTFANNIAFNSKVSLMMLTQYDNVSDDLGLNVRFRYNQSAGRDIWLVLNNNWIEDPIEDRYRSTATSAAAKIRFTFRY